MIDDFWYLKSLLIKLILYTTSNKKILINPYNLKRGIKSYHIDHIFHKTKVFIEYTNWNNNTSL
jgi:hypothetical protein